MNEVKFRMQLETSIQISTRLSQDFAFRYLCNWMELELSYIANRQRTKKINARLLKQIVRALFAELKITEAELGINLVGAKEMARVNGQFLQHEGSTDVITFDHSETPECRNAGMRNDTSRRIVHLRG